MPPPFLGDAHSNEETGDAGPFGSGKKTVGGRPTAITAAVATEGKC
jgi:hypothetical protein